jgi:hypothetical protein
MNNALRAAGVVALIVFVVAPRAALAGAFGAPELDPGIGVAGLLLLGGSAVFVIERYRRRVK